MIKESGSAENSFAQEFRDKATVLGYKAALEVVSRLPFYLGPLVATATGTTAYAINYKKRRVVRKNLAPVSALAGTKAESTVLNAFISYAQYWFESFKVGSTPTAELVKLGRADGIEYLYAAIEAGRGAIVVAPHLGNWDFAAAWIDHDRVKLNAVVENLEPEELFDWFVAQRAKFNLSVVAHNRNPMPKLIEAIRRNEVVALVADRSLDAATVEVEFFGKKAQFPMGPALLALKTGAPLLPTAAYLEPKGGHCLRILPEIEVGERQGVRADVARLTQKVATAFEALILEAPEQWHVFQPFFSG